MSLSSSSHRLQQGSVMPIPGTLRPNAVVVESLHHHRRQAVERASQGASMASERHSPVPTSSSSRAKSIVRFGVDFSKTTTLSFDRSRRYGEEMPASPMAVVVAPEVHRRRRTELINSRALVAVESMLTARVSMS